jgi:hypothetical protein
LQSGCEPDPSRSHAWLCGPAHFPALFGQRLQSGADQYF